MPQSQFTTWLDFALQQMAAESYLDDPGGLQVHLTRGNNKFGFDPPTGPLLGATRFTNLLAERFIAKYDIVDHHANDATGFSATLMRDTTTGEYTLSFRSTEYRNPDEGGDFARDGLLGADGELFSDGFALGQLAAMEAYYRDLRSSGKLPTGSTLNVTGFSLGGHLATIFTELHYNDPEIAFGHTYTFNGAGRGHITGEGTTEVDRIRQMVQLFTDIVQDPDRALPYTTADDPAYLAASGAGAGWNPFAQGSSENAYLDPRYALAKQIVLSQYDTTGLISSPAPGEVGTSEAFQQITQLFGHATHNDTEYIANRGVHGAATSIFIEDQPDLDGFGGFFGSNGDFGTTHSIVLMVDSLALQELFQTINPSLTQAEIEQIFAASSNQKASGFTVGGSGIAEGNSLENALDALGKLFVANYTPTDFGRQTGDFGSLTFRNPFYEHLAAVKTALGSQAYHIEPLLTVPGPGTPGPVRAIPADVLQARAQENTDRGLAYRYALKTLNPFAVIGNTTDSNNALYASHTSDGALDLFNDTDGTGTLTEQYLTDRALFLAEKMALNQLDQDTTTRSIHFKDVVSEYEIKTPTSLSLARREFLFGSDDLDTLTGGSKADHLYGGGSVDVLIGNAGQDYLEGNGGSDRLEGGAGADTMVGGAGNDTYLVDDPGDQVIEAPNNGRDAVESSVSFTLGTNVEDLTLTGSSDLNGTGNELDNTITGNNGINRLDGHGGTDHLIGGDKNDILLGGTGDNDLLEGGTGFDTYLYNAGDGTDRIEDSDATGRVVFNGKILQGGVSTDGGNTYVSLDGSTTYTLSGGHLIVNGVLTVNENFQSGQFGIQLTDLSSNPTDPGIPTGPFAFVVSGDASNNVFDPPGAGSSALSGNGGDDVLDGDHAPPLGAFPDLLDGGTGNDTLLGGLGNDYLLGGPGNDYAYLSDGDVFLGGDDADIMAADTTIVDFTFQSIGSGAHYAHGGAGDDVLMGALGVDVLKGGAGDDQLWGENRPAGWIGRVADGKGAFINVAQAAFVSTTGAADVLEGGGGNDYLRGDAGDDQLFSGAEDDSLARESGHDVLDGGDGGDELHGGGALQLAA